MQNNADYEVQQSLKNLTADQFMALGGNAVVYVRPIKGSDLSEMVPNAEFDDDETFQIVMGADGAPLMVADSEEAVAEWLSNRQFGVVTVH
jgi:hypothetical protein